MNQPEVLPVTSRQKARLELNRWVGLFMSDLVIVLTASLRFTHGCVVKFKEELRKGEKTKIERLRQVE